MEKNTPNSKPNTSSASKNSDKLVGPKPSRNEVKILQRKKRREEEKASRLARGDCMPSASSSHTQIFKRSKYEDAYHRITSDEFCGISESMSGESDSFRCVHRPEGKQYTEKGLLKRNILRELDTLKSDPKWTKRCAQPQGWNVMKTLAFLIRDPMGVTQVDRIVSDLQGLAVTSENGYRIELLKDLTEIFDYLFEKMHKCPRYRDCLVPLFRNMSKSIHMNDASDAINSFEDIGHYIGYLGYLLMMSPDDELFGLAVRALLWQLTAPDSQRCPGAVKLRHVLAAAPPVLYDTVVRMIAVAKDPRFKSFLDVAYVLACDTVQNCLEMTQRNIFENIFYRFNPRFPTQELPEYDINPAEVRDINLKLGESSKNISSVLSILLVLIQTLKQYLEENPYYRRLLPCPDWYAQRCFAWAFRYECRAPEHRHERNTMTIIFVGLLHIFGKDFNVAPSLLAQDVLALSVQTEVVPQSSAWARTVTVNIMQSDVQFKKLLIFLSCKILDIFPCNHFMVESQHWLVGLIYLLDPGLCQLRPRWSQALFGEIRKAALQALVYMVPKLTPTLVEECGLIRRIMWYIEWYSESPYELNVLYWCVRLLHVAIHFSRVNTTRRRALKNLFDSHGIIIVINLCNTLLKQKLPPVERSQVILALCIRIITSSIMVTHVTSCCIYPNIKWPGVVNKLSGHMLDIILYSLEKHLLISDRWLVALLNLIWEAIIWNDKYRKLFIANNGIYKLLDLITLASPAVQCITMAVICDAARAGEAVGQLVSWRASVTASTTRPNLVERGSTIASLLAAIFRDECRASGIALSDMGVLQNLDQCMMSAAMRETMKCPGFLNDIAKRPAPCLAAGDMAGSRLSKAYALLSMLSIDLNFKVALADESYNLYKNIKMSPKDEALLVLCSHYLTLKLNEVWLEARLQIIESLPEDDIILEEFLHIGRGWAKEIQLQQLEVMKRDTDKDLVHERTLYAFLGRVRLNSALDALREVQCVMRSADRARMAHVLLHEAVKAHHRRFLFINSTNSALIRTYAPELDDHNITGQNLKVYSIQNPKKLTPPSYLGSANV